MVLFASGFRNRLIGVSRIRRQALVRVRGQKVVATNRKARNDYQILDVFEAGLVPTGTEVKTLREGRASLVDGYASIDGGGACF